MAADNVAIANMALQKIGARSITALTDDTAEGRAVNAIYTDMLDEVLMEHPWTFAQRRTALGTSSSSVDFTDDGLTVLYDKPAGFLKLNFTNNSSAIVKIEEAGILSDVDDLKAIYTVRVTAVGSYPAQFVSALATRLASELAYNLVNSATKAKELYEEYEKIRLPRAIDADSTQGSPDAVKQDAWERAMISGSSDVMGRPGDETWHPTW